MPLSGSRSWVWFIPCIFIGMQNFHPFRNFERSRDAGQLHDFILDAIQELKEESGMAPTKDEVLDQLFSRERNDPEAQYLAKRLSPMILRYLRRG